MTTADTVAIVTAILLTRDPILAPEADAERRALQRARRIVARTHGLTGSEVPGGRQPSAGGAVVDP